MESTLEAPAQGAAISDLSASVGPFKPWRWAEVKVEERAKELLTLDEVRRQYEDMLYDARQKIQEKNAEIAQLKIDKAEALERQHRMFERAQESAESDFLDSKKLWETEKDGLVETIAILRGERSSEQPRSRWFSFLWRRK